jgi:threonine dehydratase
MSELPIAFDDVRCASTVVRGRVHRTPIFSSQSLSAMTGATIRMKAENLQKIGAFKARGAVNAISRLSAEARANGVICVSAGNHGIALAWAAQDAGIAATVVMPEGATQSKVAAIQDCGGVPVLVDGHRLLENMQAIVAREGQTFIHPFDNAAVMAGQGTVGMEIVEDWPEVELVVVPVGGGGLISGVATAVKTMKPAVKVIGIEPEGSTAVTQSLAAGHAVRLETFGTVADGLNAPFGGPNTLAVISQLVDDIVTVSDDQILAALWVILERTKQLVEPAGAAAVAGLLCGKLDSEIRDRNVAVILSGGNIDRHTLSTFLAPVD